jgi:hypothetical protein
VRHDTFIIASLGKEVKQTVAAGMRSLIAEASRPHIGLGPKLAKHWSFASGIRSTAAKADQAKGSEARKPAARSMSWRS